MCSTIPSVSSNGTKSFRTERLSIVSALDLTHHPDGPPLPRYSLETAAKMSPFSYAQNEIPDLARLAERQMPDPHLKVDAWARRIIEEAGGAEDVEGAGGDDARYPAGVRLWRAA